MTKLDFLLFNNTSVNKPLILDGANGTVFQQQGFGADKDLWYSHLNVSNEREVYKVHADYISAGADIITTNTFRTNPIAKRRSSLQITYTDFVQRSVKIALEAKGEFDVIIAGSNAPAEDCYQKERTISKFDLEYNHKKHIELLYKYGCDIIWNETQSHLDEIELICKFCCENSIPYSVNLFFDESLKILSGESIVDTVSLIESYSPQVIGFNCVKPELFKKYLDNFSLPKRFGFYFNCGLVGVDSSEIVCGFSPQDYVREIEKFIELKPVFVGSCCGSNCAHTKSIKEYLNEINRD